MDPVVIDSKPIKKVCHCGFQCYEIPIVDIIGFQDDPDDDKVKWLMWNCHCGSTNMVKVVKP